MKVHKIETDARKGYQGVPIAHVFILGSIEARGHKLGHYIKFSGA